MEGNISFEGTDSIREQRINPTEDFRTKALTRMLRLVQANIIQHFSSTLMYPDAAADGIR